MMRFFCDFSAQEDKADNPIDEVATPATIIPILAKASLRLIPLSVPISDSNLRFILSLLTELTFNDAKLHDK